MEKSYSKPILIVLLLLLTGVPNNIYAQYADTQDSLILVDFQNAMMQKGWPQFWDTTKNISNWRGVGINRTTGKVTEIDLNRDWFSSSFTSDSLPSCIAKLKSLDKFTELVLNNWGLKYLPREIGDLSNLEYLNLGYNNIIEVPPSLGKLTNLQYLFLISNQLTDLPKELSGLINLTYLALSSNTSLTKLPNVVTKLPALTRLIAYYSSIATIPSDIENLQNLNELRVDHNKLISLPAEIGNLPALETLYLQRNELSSLPESMGNLGKLRYLKVNMNNLKELPQSLGNLANLRSLDVSTNSLKELPQSLGNLNNLQNISFSSNQLTRFPDFLGGLLNLTYIEGENTPMEGSIPVGIFSKKGLEVHLDNNNLSGKLEIQRNKIPKYLSVKNNRFTLKDIIDHYNDFDPDPYNPYGSTFIYFQPQQNIGTFRTLKPAAGDDIGLGIENYEPATGCQITWYRADRLNGTGTAVATAADDTLNIEDFDPATDAGVYYCIVTHPDLDGLSLTSNRICLIGDTDTPPSLSAGDVLFRCGTDAVLYLYINDDYTRVKDMIFDIPDTTRHFILRPDSVTNYPNSRYIFPKEGVLAAVDTVKVSVTDGGGNISSTEVIIKMVTAENQPPEINVPLIYMNLYDGMELTCIPEDPNCSESYYFISETFLNNYVTDDYTSAGKLTFSAVIDSIHGVVSDSIISIGLNSMQLLVEAQSDVSAYISLTASDDEGGSTTKQIQLKGIGMSKDPDDSNDIPQIAPIPEQVIERGTAAFPPLNLKEYITDDYLPFEELDIVLSPKSVNARIRNDSMLYVSPLHADSVYSGSLVFTVAEKRNSFYDNIAEIYYRVVDRDLSVRFEVTANGLPFNNALIYINGAYFSSDAMGHATVSLPNNGSYSYTITDTYMQSDTDYRDATGTVTLAGTGITENVQLIPESPTDVHVLFVVTDRGYPVPNALIDVNGAFYQTDWGGHATVTFPMAGSYNYTVSDIYVGNPVGYQPFSGTVTVSGTDVTENVQLTLKNATAINDEPRATEAPCIYPNPVHGILYIDLPSGTKADAVEVCDITGIKIYSTGVTGLSSVQIDMGDYPEGVYVVRGLLKGKVVFSGKVIRGLP